MLPTGENQVFFCFKMNNQPSNAFGLLNLSGPLIPEIKSHLLFEF